MKNINNISILIALLFLMCPRALKAQDKFYTSTGMEMQFSWAVIKQNGIEASSIMRWAPVFNIQTFFNYDLNENFGVFSGIGIRNVGFIYDEDEYTRKKYRTYNLGVPFGIKAGNLKKLMVFAGYEIEFPFTYKEKTIINEQKSKYKVWFSGRVPVVYNTLFVGVQLPKGLNLKFKYYLTNFFDKDFVEIDQDSGEPFKPYESLDVNILFISLGMNLFKDKDFYFEVD